TAPVGARRHLLDVRAFRRMLRGRHAGLALPSFRFDLEEFAQPGRRIVARLQLRQLEPALFGETRPLPPQLLAAFAVERALQEFLARGRPAEQRARVPMRHQARPPPAVELVDECDVERAVPGNVCEANDASALFE